MERARRGIGEDHAELDLAAAAGQDAEAREHDAAAELSSLLEQLGVSEARRRGRGSRGEIDGEAEILRGVGEEGIQALGEGEELGVGGAGAPERWAIGDER